MTYIMYIVQNFIPNGRCTVFQMIPCIHMQKWQAVQAQYFLFQTILDAVLYQYKLITGFLLYLDEKVGKK